MDSLERLEEGIERAMGRLADLRAERDALRSENARLAAEVHTLRDRVAAYERAAPGADEIRRLRVLERQRRELRGRVADLLRLAEALTQEEN